MLVTDDDEFYRRCLFLRDHGREPGERMFWNTAIAYKYKMSSIQAALGLAQTERIDELVAKKKAIFSWYQELLQPVGEFTLNHQKSGMNNVYWMVTAIIDSTIGIPKEVLMKLLAERDIDTRPFFYPLSSLPAYDGLPQAKAARARNTNAYSISPYGINLPSSLSITPEEVAYVCDHLKEILVQRTINA